MSKKHYIFSVFSVLIGALLIAIWSNIHAYAQQQSLPPEVKAKMCDPSNPSLKVVNATESRICGIPRTVKPHTSSAATPPTLSVSSSTPPQTTTNTKPKTANITALKQQQEVKASNNNAIDTISEATGGPTGTTTTPVSHIATNAPSSSIAPQIKAVDQRQQPPTRGMNSTTAPQVKVVNQQLPPSPSPSTTTPINGTSGQKYSSAATPPLISSGKLMYLGYHDSKSNPSNYNSNSTDKSISSNSKSSSHHHTKDATTDNRSIGKSAPGSHATTDSSSSIDNGNSNPNFSTTNDGSTSSSSDLASVIKNEVHSIIRGTIGGIIHKTPFLLPFH